MSITKLTLEQLASIRLDKGDHQSPDQGHCLLEVVSMFAGEPFSDEPQCVDPILRSFGIAWNDAADDDERQQLKRYIPLLPGTNKGNALSQVRGWMAADWLIRTHLPAWLDRCAATAEHAATLRALAPITDESRLAAAQSALDQARSAAAAARDAARDAAWAAARDAAWAAAWDAARAAAWDAARDAAWAAARDAAWAAAWDAARAAAWDAAWDAARAAARDAARAAAWHAAWDAARDAARAAAWDAAREDQYKVARAAADQALKTTQQELRASAHDLFLRMINAELREDAAQRATDESAQ